MDNTTTFKDEWFPIVSTEGRIIGKATRRQCHSGTKWLHPVVHLHVFNLRGELFLQKRPMHKDIQPGKWDTAVGGHVDYGETIEDALRREACEELRITHFNPQKLGSYIFESAVEKELVTSFKTCYDGVISPDENELDGGRFWNMDEVRASLGKGVFTPNFENEFLRYFGQ